MELIGGVIVEMSPAGIPHNHFLITVVDIFGPLLGKYKFAIQGTLTVAEGHVFDPDFMLLRQRPDGYKSKLPDAADVQLIIEASESSFRKDQQLKLPIYAAAGIQEYWIADLNEARLLIHRNPEGTGYRMVEARRGDEIVSPLAAPELSFAVRRAFD